MHAFCIKADQAAECVLPIGREIGHYNVLNLYRRWILYRATSTASLCHLIYVLDGWLWDWKVCEVNGAVVDAIMPKNRFIWGSEGWV